MKEAEEMSESCLAVRVRAVNRAITGIYDEALRPLGVKVSQLNVLVAIASTGEAKAKTVSASLHLEKSSLSRSASPRNAPPP